MKEIGGYFELECFKTPPFHPKATALNSGRNALRHLIRTYQIKEILAPQYTCPVVFDALESENCRVLTYSIDENFIPKLNPKQQNFQNAFILYNNYFGICGSVASKLADQYPNLILDNAQAFYSPKKGLAAFYSPRKFFGLPDGGILITEKHLNEPMDKDTSFDRCSHLLKRHDLPASDGYSDFQTNDESLVDQPMRYMSALTYALMGNIDYERARKKRLENFQVLHDTLRSANELQIDLIPEDVPLVYPLLLKNDKLRRKLIENKVYVATYWPDLEKYCTANSYELYLKQYLLPLPIDQRYGADEMKFILGLL